MTWLDLLILAITLAAAVAGFRTLGGTGRAGRLLGVLVGAGAGLGVGVRLAGYGADGGTRLALLVVGIVAAVLLGGAIGGWLGGLLTRVLLRARLTIVDRGVGGLAGAGSALLVLWVLATAVPALLGPGPLEPLALILQPLGGHSTVLDAVPSALPSTTGDLTALLRIAETVTAQH